MDKKIAQLLEDIKKLLILIAIQNGADSKDVAKALDIDSSTVRHIVSVRKAQKSQK